LQLLLYGCQSANHPAERVKPDLTVATAANLSSVIREIGLRFESETGTHIVCSFGSTGNLARQIEQSAPFDVFAAADTEHVEALDKKDLLVAGTRVIYARGRLALWVPAGNQKHIAGMKDLIKPSVRFVAIARPESAPYGRASVEALQALKLWSAVQPKVVYAENITMAKQYAQTGNADASFTAYSLVFREPGKVILVDDQLYRPIDQAAAVLQNSQKQASARQFLKFLLGPKGREILQSYGYVFPPA
jgi:molybdate transport system substrate-binding protein